MALNALTLAVTQGVVGRPFVSAVNGLTYPQRVEVLVDGSPGGSYVNGIVFFSSLPYPTSTIVLREYEPGVGAGLRDSRIDITAATVDSLRAQAISSLSAGRSLVRWRVASTRQSDGSFVYSLFVEDDQGATVPQAVGGAPTPTPAPTITQPSISPGSGTAGSTIFTGTDGTPTNGTITAREWLIGGVVVATGGVFAPTSAQTGSLTYRNTVTGAGGTASNTSAAVTIAAAAPAVPFQSVDAGGYSVTSSTPIAAGTTFTLSQAGYDASGNPTSYPVTMTVYGPVRSLAPSLTFAGATSYAISETIWSADSAGATNNSTAVSPKGAMRWQQAPAQVVGNTLAGSLIGAHISARDGKPFACVVVTATDGTNTVSQTITAPTLGATGRDAATPEGAIRVPEYNFSLDISTLAAGLITVNAKCYPWIGTAAAIIDTSGGTANAQGFAPQVFRKDAAAVNGARNFLYLDASTGNDATAYVGSDPTQAAAAPALTLTGAMNRARAVLGTATGSLDGLEMRARAGTWEFSATPTANTVNANVIFTRDPAVARANVTFQFGTANVGPGCTHFRVRDVKMRRNGANRLPVANLAVRDVDYDNVSQAGVFFNAIGYIEGGFSVVNQADCLSPTSGQQLRLLRGATLSGGTAIGTPVYVEADCVVGCYADKVHMSMIAGKAATYYDGAVIFCNKFTRIGGSNDWFAVTYNVTGLLLAQNCAEWASAGATPGPALGLSRDSQTYNLTGVMCINNTVVGANNAGRLNAFYDETSATARSHKYNVFANNIFSQINHKNGYYLYSHFSTVDGRSGALEFFNGTNCFSNYALYTDAGPNQPDFHQDYPGSGTTIGTSATVPLDPKFNSYLGVTYNGSAYTAGAGGGDLRLGAGSACRGAALRSLLSHDLLGNARTASADTIGCYA